MKYAVKRPLSNEELSDFAGLSPILGHLLFHRGINSSAQAEKFLNPDYDNDVHDPSLLVDAGKTADRIIQAIKNGEKIAIYADYDADGIPGAAVWHDFFTRIGYGNFTVYIPHRHDEGFGVNIDAVAKLADEGVDLMMTVDCGISDHIAVAKANDLGIEVIITDHHEPPKKNGDKSVDYLPPAFAVVDPKRSDCQYPDKNICGAGVAYKVIQAVLKKDRFGLKEGMEKWLLDLVGMATLSDMVPLVGENRIFAHYGLAVLKKTPRKGLRKLLEKLKISQKHINEDDIGYMITPRINAASRMGVPKDAFLLLTAGDDVEASKYADHLDHINNERKAAVAVLVKEVKKTLKQRHGSTIDGMPSVIVLGNPAWRPSLLGLAANSCATEFNRPVFLWGRDGDNCVKGSCRSEGRTNVVELMRSAPTGVFSQCGGHRYSGGFTVSDEQIHYLDQHLNKVFANIGNSHENTTENNVADMELELNNLDWKLYDDIAKLAPFGHSNEKPVFLFKNVLPAKVRKFGKNNEHIGLDFQSQNGKIEAISFFATENKWANEVKAGQPVDLVASLEKSVFRGRPELRLRIADVIINP